MVLQHARSYPQSSRPHPNPARIIGMAGTIALNIVLLMLLLVPMTAPPPEVVKEKPTWYQPIDKKPKPIATPVDATIVKPAIPTPNPSVKPDIKPVVDVPVIVDDGMQMADAVVDQPVDTSQIQITPTTGPIAGVRLEYAHAPSPPYLIDELRAGHQGVVMLQILVDVDGRPLDVSVQKSSGFRKLDEAARRFVLKNWTFHPAMQNGRAVQAIGIVPIDFNLG
ncbi:MAG: TonB family protein [Luteimonas sp.]